MFDIGISELGLIGLVALIVIGPEQLPRVARTVGHLTGRLRRYVADVKSDISREMDMADLRRMQEEIQTASAAIEQTIHNEVSDLSSSVHEVTAAAQVEVIDASPVASVQGEAMQDGAPQRDENQPDLFADPAAPEPEPHGPR